MLHCLQNAKAFALSSATVRMITPALSYSSKSTARPEPQYTDSLMTVGTRSIFNEEHDMFRETARGFFNKSVVPYHAKWEEEGQISRECWKEAGSLGLLCVTMPEKYGGVGADILSSAVVWEEQSYTGCTGPGFALHSEIVAPYIFNYGTEAQKQKYLPKLASGEWVGAIAMTEPAAGSDLQGMKSTAFQTTPGGDFVLNGSKTFITNGALADVVIVCAKTDVNAKGSKGISLLLVETGMKGFERGKKLKKLGLRAQDTSELFFDNVHVPAENLLGTQNEGFRMLMQELPQERLLIADMAVAASEAAFEWTRTYMKERFAFGRPLIKQQLLRHGMANLKTQIVVGRTFIDYCLNLHKDHRLDTQTASMAKAWATDLQGRVADDTVQLHGGYGFIWDYAVTRNYADARVQRIYGGTNEIMMDVVSRTI